MLGGGHSHPELSLKRPLTRTDPLGSQGRGSRTGRRACVPNCGSVFQFMKVEMGQEVVFNFPLSPTSNKLELDHQTIHLVYMRLYCLLWGAS